MHPRRPVRYADLNRELLERVPEIFQGYAQLKAMWDGDEPGPHILYEDLLVPFLTTLLSTGGEIALVTVFAFLEELAESNDQEVRNVLGASVLEGLSQLPTIWATARQYMGPSTKQLADDIENA